MLVFGVDGRLHATIRVKPLEPRLRPTPDGVRPITEAQVLELRADELGRAFASREIRAAVWLSLVSCSVTAILSVWVAVPLGYLLSRTRFPGRAAIDLLLDVPLVLPPLVIGLSLLILFQTAPGVWFERYAFPVTYAVAGVVLAQFAVSAAFAARTMRVTFDQINPRAEQVAGRSPQPERIDTGDREETTRSRP